MSNEILDRQAEVVFGVNLASPKKNNFSESSSGDKESGVATDAANINVLGEIFKLEFYPLQSMDEESKLNLQNLVAPSLQPLLHQLHEHLGLNIGVVERICLVEESILGDIIFQIQREKGLKPDYTGQKGHYHTAAKTISYAVEEEKVKSVIVMNVNLFGGIIVAFQEGKPYHEWEVGQQLCYYILAHEYGHAKDNYIRKEISTDTTHSVEELDWEKWSEYYAPLLFNEFLACVIASKSVTPALQQNLIDAWHADIEKFTDILGRNKMSYLFDMREAIGAFWLLLVQLAKLLGHDRGEENLPAITYIKEWDDEEREKEHQSIINELGATLETFLENYPAIPSDKEITEKLTPYFIRLAATYSFFFGDDNEGMEND